MVFVVLCRFFAQLLSSSWIGTMFYNPVYKVNQIITIQTHNQLLGVAMLPIIVIIMVPIAYGHMPRFWLHFQLTIIHWLEERIHNQAFHPSISTQLIPNAFSLPKIWNLSYYFVWLSLEHASGTWMWWPKTAAEIWTLTQSYKESELHSFRSGQIMDTDVLIDDFQNGVCRLCEGKFRKWIDKTTSSQVSEMQNQLYLC